MCLLNAGWCWSFRATPASTHPSLTEHPRARWPCFCAGSSDSAGAAWETGAISSAQALKRYSEYLTAYEQSEILDFPQVATREASLV